MPVETVEHQELKRLSFAWTREQGYSCCGFEVRLPNCGYRADVAAYRPASEVAPFVFEGKTSRRRQAAIGTTAVFECKQSRADLQGSQIANVLAICYCAFYRENRKFARSHPEAIGRETAVFKGGASWP